MTAIDGETAARARSWLTDRALPLWSDAGVDPADGGFTERLRLDGTPDRDVAKRVRVQARQIYVFSHAKLLGLAPDGDAVATRGYEFLLRHACPEGADHGFVHALDRFGRVVDDRRDTYDHAFVLFAFSWYLKATGRTDVRDAIDAVRRAIERHLRHPSGEGYRNDAAGGLERSQNPHMHLFEAVLAAFEATGDAAFLSLADELDTLFRTRLFDRGRGVLPEFFGADWQPITDSPIEPGHHCEWAWLLKWHADLSGRPLADEARTLFAFARAHGRPNGSALLCDELWPDGRVRSGAIRTWPQTEAVKAEVAIAEADRRPLAPLADAIVAETFATFLDDAVPGGWIDRRGADGAPLVDTIPASSLYHLFLGFAEYLRARAGLRCGSTA